MTDEFVRYARPLVGEDMITLPLVDGRQRLARLQPIYAAQKLPKYVPQADRQEYAPRACRPAIAHPGSDFLTYSEASTMFDITPKHKFLVGIDSDGCAFDTMELKHKECFIPNIIQQLRAARRQQVRPRGGRVRQPVFQEPRHQSLSGPDRDARVAAKRPEVQARGIDDPHSRRAGRLDEGETKLANPALAAAVEEDGRSRSEAGLAWSKAVNETIDRMVRGVPPFPVRARVAWKSCEARPTCWSSRPRPTKRSHREWEEHDLDKYVAAICGQEIGTKKEMLGRRHEISAAATR